jgi:hypothetical protein
MKLVILRILSAKMTSMNTSFSYYVGSLQDFLAKIKETTDNTLIKTKLDVKAPDSFCHVLDNFAVRHIYAKHSNEKEVLRGQIIVEDSDLLLIPDILNNYDKCETIVEPNGKTLLTYSKTYPDCIRFYVETVRQGRHELAGVTFYKRKRKLTGAKS